MTEKHNTEYESRVKSNMTQEISADDLQAGGFVFQLPEGTEDEERQAFEKTIEDAKTNGANLTLSHEVKVIDTTAKPKGQPNTIQVGVQDETEEEPETEDAQAEPEQTGQEEGTQTPQQQQPAPKQVQQPQQQFVPPKNDVQYTNNQAWQYDPFTGNPIGQPAPQQPVPQQAQPQQQYTPNPQVQGYQQGYNPQPVYQQPQQQPPQQPQNNQGQRQNSNQ